MAKSVFEQLYDDPQKAATYSAKADLMIVISQLIEKSGLSNTKAAELLGTPRSRVSELMNGKIDKISLDTLNAWLSVLSGGQLKMAVVATESAANPSDIVSTIN